MPQNITAVPQFTTTAPTRPIPGEKVAMETGPAPLAPLLQLLTDRDNFLWQQAHALMPWCGEVEITASDLVLPSLAFTLVVGGAWVQRGTAGGSVALTPLAAVSNEWRYAYLIDNGAGGIAVEFSATVPDASLLWKNGATGTHRYLCPIRMSSVAGAAVPLRGRNGHWVYKVPRAAKTWTVNEALTATSLSEVVPLHVRRARVSLRVTGPDTTVPVYVRVFSAGTVDPPSIEHRALAAANTIPVADVDVGPTRVLNTIVESLGSAEATLRADGFSE